jgi:hypothetical protein
MKLYEDKTYIEMCRAAGETIDQIAMDVLRGKV